MGDCGREYAAPCSLRPGSSGLRRVLRVRDVRLVRELLRPVAGGMAAVTVCCSGCLGAVRSAADTITPVGAAIAVTIRPPRELLELKCGDQLREYRRVVRITGRVGQAAGDTLGIVVTSLTIEGASQDVGVRRGCTASVVRDQSTSVDIMSRRPGRIEAGLGIGILGLVAATLVFAWAIAQGS